MQKRIMFILLLTTMFFRLAADKPFYVINGENNDKLSVISVLYIAIKALDEYEKGLTSGISVSYNNDGKYYHPDRGSNWWEYYCEPLIVGSELACEHSRMPNYHKLIMFCQSRCEMPLADAHTLFNKYIKIKPYLLERAQKIVAHVNNMPLIGIYYTKPAPGWPQPRVPFEEVYAQTLKARAQFSSPSKIFIISNDRELYSFMYARLGSDIITLDVLDELNLQDGNLSIAGEVELIFSLIFSQCDLFIKTATELADFVSVINPQLPVVQLGENGYTAL